MGTGLPAGRLAGLALAVSVILFLAVRVSAELMGGAADGAEAHASEAPEAPEAPVEEAPVLAGVVAPQPEAEVLREAPAPAPVGLKVGVNDRIRVVVEVDGEPWFKGYLCPDEGPRCDRKSPLEVPPSTEIAVELSDLSHARLVYNGRRVEPLGNLVTGRRLVFVDDAGL